VSKNRSTIKHDVTKLLVEVYDQQVDGLNKPRPIADDTLKHALDELYRIKYAKGPNCVHMHALR
jgi:hypothetical protein